MSTPLHDLLINSELRRPILMLAACFALLLAANLPAHAQITITEINPNQSSLDATDPDGASGGRVNGLAAAPGSNQVFYAASEWGGLYKSTNAGRNWTRLNGHLPTVTWDVEVSPGDANRVIATSFYDGRVNSRSGISVSTDGGNTWSHPATATPPAGFCTAASRREEPAAFGVSFDRANPRNVFVGTNCGIAISNDAGVTWRFVDPTPTDGADDVWDVVVHHGGIIDLCGDDGHRRSTNGGATWTTATGTPLPSGRCSIAASPDEAHVIFASVGVSIFESDNGGTSWGTQFANPTPQGRIPFVATNQRGGAAFDLWFGDVSLFRAGCTTPSPATPGGAPRCPPSNTWAGGFTRGAGGHDDSGDILFDPRTNTSPQPLSLSSRQGCLQECATERAECLAEVGQPGGPLPAQCAQRFTQCRERCSGGPTPTPTPMPTPTPTPTPPATGCLQECAAERAECLAEVGQPGGPLPAQCAQRFSQCRQRCSGGPTPTPTPPNAITDPCPLLFSSDGGVYFNTKTTSPDCHTPAWEQPDMTPHGLWLFGMSGAPRAGASAEDLYFGNQDNGAFGTTNAGVASPIWTNRECCDGFDDSASNARVLYTVCCFSPAPANRLLLRNPGMTGGGFVPNNSLPPGNLPGFKAIDIIDRFGTQHYVLLTTSGIFVTTNVTASPIVWTQLGAATTPPNACGVRASGTTANPTFYVESGSCAGSSQDALFKFTGTAPGGAWQRVQPPGNTGGFGIFNVDPGNANRLFASHITNTTVDMVQSADGGLTWTVNAALNNQLTGGGVFKMRTVRGSSDFTGFNGYVQPTLIAQDPFDRNIMIAGGADSGVFLSRNGGATWTVVTDNSGTAARPHIPRPRFAYFSHEECRVDIYVGTQGRGVWRLSFNLPGITPTAEQIEACRRECAADRADCLSNLGPGGPRPAQCVQLFNQCRARCTQPQCAQ